MNSWILFLTAHAFSLGFAFVSISRLYSYIRRYQFDESKYTLLLGFVHLRWIALAYLFFVFAWIPASFFFFHSLL